MHIFKRICLATLAVALVQGCATPSSPMADLYLYHGLKPAEGPEANDGVFQDFENDADALARIWADPDATLHKGEENAWVQAYVDRSGEQPHLSVMFERAGYGTSIELAPKGKTPELVPENGMLEFELMAQEPVCVGVRVQERDGEVWGYGKEGLKYKRQCTKKAGEWETFQVAIDPEHWFKFIYGGNTNLGDGAFEGNMIVSVSFEIGLAGEYWFAQGNANLNIRNIEVAEQAEPQIASR